MRIGQLARRLGISPSDILTFLSGKGIEVESGANARLAEEVVHTVINHFAPEKAEEPIELTPEEIAEEQTPAPTPVAEEPTAPVEVIRVSKVELQGLKVLGKIDLPAPKKKVEETSTEQQQEPDQEQPQPQQQPRREFQKRPERREQRDQRQWKNPIEQKRQQEQREAERKKKEQAEKLKEKRTNHYYNKVKSVPTKPARKISEETVVEEIEVKEPPKGIIGKFLRWLRT